MYTNSANPRGDRDDMRVVSTANGEEAAVEESTEVSKSTTETLMAGERIMEALEISEVDRAAKKAYEEETKRLPEELAKRVPPPSRNPIFSMYNNCQAEEYVLKVVRSIPAAGLQDALLVLPFGKVIQLIEHLDYWAQRVSLFGYVSMVVSTSLTSLNCLRRNGLCRSPLAYSSSFSEPTTRKSSQPESSARQWSNFVATSAPRSSDKR